MDQTQTFYLISPSNSSMQIYPTNTLTNFTTQLQNSLFVDGDWEVRLAEIQYPYTWNNTRPTKNRTYIITWNERDYTSLEIRTGNYDNINNVTYNWKQLILATNKFRKDDVDICYASIDKRMSVYVTNNCYLRLEGDVAMILGFEPGATISNSLVTSPYLSLSTGNVSSLYVYTNIIHIQYAGDVKVPLLRIVGVEGQHGKSVIKTFVRPQCLPVCRQTLYTIEVDIKGDASDSISFQHRKVVVKLHFRKQRSAYFS